MPTVYDIGDENRYYGTFTDTAGTAYDPGTVNFLLIPPGDRGTYFTYASGSVARVAAGTYSYDYRHVAGGYTYTRWEGTGTINAVFQGRDFTRYMGTGI
jgi:hypothetical protein